MRGHRVNGLYPQHPSLGELLDAMRSRGWEITRERTLRGIQRRPRKRGVAVSRVWGRVGGVEGLS